MIPTTPGVYPNLAMADYLAIPALSSGVARTLVDRCPRAAWHDSYLNPDRERHDTSATDLGTIAHGILLEGSTDKVKVIDPRDHPAEKTGNIPDGFTNKSIRQARDLARAEGLTPILLADFVAVQSMVDAAWEYLASVKQHEPAIHAAFQPDGGESEVTMVWQDGATLCKLRTDRISSNTDLIVDYKTSAMSVDPDRWGRTQMVSMGYYFSAAWYRRGVHALTTTTPDYVFLCQEVEAPHLCSLVGCDPATLALGEDKVRTALERWQHCVCTDNWPAYPSRVVYPELPPWEAARWMEKTTDAQGYPYDPAKLFSKEAA